ncbi:MAG: DUF5661 family protein [Patescibacteria group bacterium]
MPLPKLYKPRYLMTPLNTCAPEKVYAAAGVAHVPQEPYLHSLLLWHTPHLPFFIIFLLGLILDDVGQQQFRAGLDVELEHGTRDASTNVTDDDPIITGKIALAHLNEFPDYYTRLDKLEKEAETFWEGK